MCKFPLGVFSWKQKEQLSDFVFKGNYAFGNWGQTPGSWQTLHASKFREYCIELNWWIPFISRAPFMQQTCFQGVAVKCIIKQSYQTCGFMTAEFPEANPLAKASSWYLQETVCNQIQAGPTATPNHFNLTIFLLSAYSHLTVQVGSSSYKNSHFFPPRLLPLLCSTVQDNA